MRLHRTLPIFFVLIVFSACKSTTTIVENDVGSFQGKVTLYDVNGHPFPQQSGAITSIEGTYFSGTSDTSGSFQIDNVPAGVYTIVTTKPDFDSARQLQYEFSGAGVAFLEGLRIQAEPFDSIILTPSVSIVSFDSVIRKDTVIFGDTSLVADTILNGAYPGTLSLSIAIAGPDSNINFQLVVNNTTHPHKISTGTVYPIPESRVITLPLSTMDEAGDNISITTTAVSEWLQSISPYTVTKTYVIP